MYRIQSEELVSQKSHPVESLVVSGIFPFVKISGSALSSLITVEDAADDWNGFLQNEFKFDLNDDTIFHIAALLVNIKAILLRSN